MTVSMSTGDWVERALRLYAKSLGLPEAYASGLYLHLGNQADTELALDIIVDPSIYNGGIAALSDWQYAGSFQGLMAEMGRRDAQRIVRDLTVMGEQPVVLLTEVLAALEPGRHAGNKHSVTKQVWPAVAPPKQPQASAGHKEALKGQQTGPTGRPAAGARVITAPRRSRQSQSNMQIPIQAGAGRNAARQGLAAQSQKASAQSAAKKVPRNQELSAKQKALFDQATGTGVKVDANPYAALSDEQDSNTAPQTAAGAEEDSHATMDAGSSSSPTTAVVVAEPSTAEREAKPTATVEELATAAEGACPAVAGFDVITSAPSSAARSTAIAEDAQKSSTQAARTFNAGAVPSAAPRASTPGATQAATAEAAAVGDVRGKSWCYTWLQHALEQESRDAQGAGTGGSKNSTNITRAAGSQTANEPAADPERAPPAAGSSEGPGHSSGRGPPTSPALKTGTLLPVSRHPAKMPLGGIGREGSKAASMVAKPAAQEQQPPAAVAKESNIKTGLGEGSKPAAQSVADTTAVLAVQGPSRSKGKRKAGKGKTSKGKTGKGKRKACKGASSPAGEPTATPPEEAVIDVAAAKGAPTRTADVAAAKGAEHLPVETADVAAAKGAERLPVRTADVAGVGTLPAQQDPAENGSKATLTGARGATLDTASIGGDSRIHQATSSPAAGAGHPSGEQQPARPKESTCKEAQSSRGTVNAVPPRQLTSKSAVAVKPAVQCHSKPAGMSDAATLKLTRTGETGAKGSHYPTARLGSQAGVSAPTTCASKSGPKVEEGQNPCGNVPASQACISSRTLPSGQTWPAGSASRRRAASDEWPTWISSRTLPSGLTWPAGSATRRRAASSEWPTWIGRAALLFSVLFLLCFFFGRERPLSHSEQAGLDIAAASAGASHHNSSSKALYSPATSLWAQQSAAAAARGSPVGSISHLAWSAVPALDVSSRAASVEDAASACRSILTSSPAVAVQDARSAVAAADGGPFERAEPAAVQAASSSLGAAVGESNDTRVHIAQLTLNQTRSSIVREALGVVSVLARHNAWLVKEALDSLQGTNEAAMQGLRQAVKDPLAAALGRAAAAERQAAAAEKVAATVTAEHVALVQHSKQLVQQLAEANAARTEAEQRLTAAGLEPAAGGDGGGAAQQPEGALAQEGHRHEQMTSEAPAAAQRMAAQPPSAAGVMGA